MSFSIYSIPALCESSQLSSAIGQIHFVWPVCLSALLSAPGLMFYGLFCFFLLVCVYILGGYLINLLLSDTRAWCWRFLLILESWGQRGEEGQTGRPGGRGRTERHCLPVGAETGLCLEPAAVPRCSPWQGSSWRWRWRRWPWLQEAQACSQATRDQPQFPPG